MRPSFFGAFLVVAGFVIMPQPLAAQKVGNVIYHLKSFSYSNPNTPPGFFGPGSDPLLAPLQLEGSLDLQGPLANMPLGIGNSQQLPIQIVGLNLQSVQPVIVTFNGGMNPQPWNVTMGLSPTPSPPSEFDITRTQPNGGTFTATLGVQPLYTFTRVGFPLQQEVWDTGPAGPLQRAPFLFETFLPDPAPWASNGTLDLIDPPPNFFAGVDPLNGSGPIPLVFVDDATGTPMTLVQELAVPEPGTLTIWGIALTACLVFIGRKLAAARLARCKRLAL